MTTLHMETDTVRAMVNQLKQTAEAMRSQAQVLNSSAQNADWIGPSRDEFVSEVEGILRQLDAQVESCIALAGRCDAEVAEWETTSSSFGASAFDFSKLPAINGDFLKPTDVHTMPWRIGKDEPGILEPL